MTTGKTAKRIIYPTKWPKLLMITLGTRNIDQPPFAVQLAEVSCRSARSRNVESPDKLKRNCCQLSGFAGAITKKVLDKWRPGRIRTPNPPGSRQLGNQQGFWLPRQADYKKVQFGGIPSFSENQREAGCLINGF